MKKWSLNFDKHFGTIKYNFGVDYRAIDMVSRKNGCFIVFEGIEGSGKTTQLNLLAQKLEKQKYDVVKTREPTKYLIGNLIRNILYGNFQVEDETLALLFAADRVEHTKKIILPALKQGKIVLCDRYLYSSLSYQTIGISKPLSLEWIKTINKYAVQPDIIIYLDVPAEVGLYRLESGQRRIKDYKYFLNEKKLNKIREMYHKVLNLNRKEKDMRLFNLKLIRGLGRKFLDNLYYLDNSLVLKLDGCKDQKEIAQLISEFVLTYLKLKYKKSKKEAKENMKPLLLIR